MSREDAEVIEATPVVQRRGSSLAGRPITSAAARRLVHDRRERTTLRMWKRAPAVVTYVCRVALGEEPYDEGRLKAAQLILSRTMPTVTSQQVDSTSISATVTPDVEMLARKILAETAE
jgi:hypothetical protein